MLVRKDATPLSAAPVEEWRLVVGHEGYDVSSLGRVRSWRRGGTISGRRDEPRIRKQVPNKDGYLTLMFVVDGRYVLRYVHHLVLEAFKGPRPEGTETRHLDRDITNNCIKNLEWGTHTENVADQIAHGMDTRGERNGGAKLTYEEAEEVRTSPDPGDVIAERFGISQATVSRIRSGQRYSEDARGREAKPVLKWAGSKRQLVERLLQFFPSIVEHYVEPFFGGGALFFAMRNRGAFKRATIADANEDLVNLYKVVRDNPTGLIARLSKYEVSEEAFYKIRAWIPSTLDPVRRAARIVYLNKTCFNGLYRVNLKGQFNVPWGKYKNPRVCDPEGIVQASRALRGVEILCGDFERVVAPLVRPGVAVYMDPPYWPASATANFTAYSADGFGAEDHRRLRDCALRLRLRAPGAHVVLSNADVEPVRALYQDGFQIHEVEAKRNINSKGDGRGPIGELIIVAR